MVNRLFWPSRDENLFFGVKTTRPSMLVIGTQNNNIISYANFDEITRLEVMTFPD